ncbi:MAG: nuclear transport factor 2 family protein [Woeseiaceae bacterium]
MAAELTHQGIFEIKLALHELNADFCHYLDQRETDRFANLFTEDAIYTHGSRASHGRAAIHALFDKRNKAGTRTTRHLQTGLRIQLVDEYLAKGSSVCMTFAADATPPISHAVPHLIADFIDEYMLCEDMRWRISRRHIERIFVAPGNEGPAGSK